MALRVRRHLRLVAFSLAILAAASVRADDRRQVLQVFPAAPYAYELALENCPRGSADGGAACSVAVRLLEGGRTLDRVNLAQPACGPARPAPWSRSLGADRDAKAWSTSDENCEIEVAARTLTLGPNATALLVTELQGFEYRYRSHALYLPRKGALAELWRHDEDSIGSHATTVTVIPGRLAGEDLAFLDVEKDASGVANKFGARRLHFDAAAGQIVGDQLPDLAAPLFVVRVGSFKSLREADVMRSRCRELLPMPGGLFPGLRLPAFFLGDVYARRGDADAARARLATCAGAKNESTVHEYRATRARRKGSTDAGHQ